MLHSSLNGIDAVWALAIVWLWGRRVNQKLFCFLQVLVWYDWSHMWLLQEGRVVCLSVKEHKFYILLFTAWSNFIFIKERDSEDREREPRHHLCKTPFWFYVDTLLESISVKISCMWFHENKRKGDWTFGRLYLFWYIRLPTKSFWFYVGFFF